MEAVTYYPGSIGEIIQGNYKGRDVLLSCPINLFTKVRIFECNKPAKKEAYKKSSLLLANLLHEWNLKEYINCLDIEINSNIPKEKGFASSTADLCGVYYSLVKMFKREADEEELIRECIKIEPTDSIIFSRMTIFDYKYGEYKESIGEYLGFYLLVFEGNNKVNTIEFNNKNKILLSKIDDIVELLKVGIINKDLKSIGRVSTESIKRNQYRLKHDNLEQIIKLQKATNGLGIMGAHSGCVMAIIYEDYKSAQKALEKCNIRNMQKIYIVKTRAI